ncbi:ribosome hibernation-promoting factor, HPF/YfiA family [Akkermansia muciniphila]|uniref:ribosome hibernation-promoting factor, HPF/YfiA family n=1 Tax=Akkermansia muciniphila TaxID=239935 RepID=UPI00122F83B7|nr:ribosome-associated translation inhibitor RaiA [Akkermansia muciniphila]KAA3384448.1 ribosome-associated translation inhibitor RaiA [Akkermansia muciniphila]
MKYNVTQRKAQVRQSFLNRLEKKLAKFDRFFGDDAVAQVTVSAEGNRETVEITIRYKNMVYRAEKTTENMYESLEIVTDVLFRQIVKNKTKLEARLRDNAFSEVSLPEELEVSGAYGVSRTKEFPVKPMGVEEAILQMNMLGHAFFIFENVDGEEINVVYKRKDGTYGLLIPTK